MGKMFSHISFEQRKIIEALSKTERPKTEIAEKIGVSTATLYRELQRIPEGQAYSARAAQLDYDRNSTNKGTLSLLEQVPGLAEYIADRILSEHCSPATIADDINEGRSPFKDMTIGTHTIYNHIQAGKIPGVTESELPLKYSQNQGRRIRDEQYRRGKAEPGDMLLMQNCTTCEFNFGDICAGHGWLPKEKDNDTYGKKIDELLDLFPFGCDDFGISFEAFTLQEKVNGR